MIRVLASEGWDVRELVHSYMYDPEPTLALLQAEATELVKIALGSLENNEAENQRALDAFNLAAVDRSGAAAAAIFEVRRLETNLPDRSVRNIQYVMMSLTLYVLPDSDIVRGGKR